MSNFTREDAIKCMTEVEGVTTAMASTALDALLGGMSAAFVEGKTVMFKNFGSFTVATRRQREGRNPKTGAVITIAAKKHVKFALSPKVAL